MRQALDVESGLNDGLAVPFFLVALDIANAELKGGVMGPRSSTTPSTRSAGGSPAGSSPALPVDCSSGWRSGAAGSGRAGGRSCRWRPPCSLTPSPAALGGSGFIAAFVGGMVFGRASGEHGAALTLFTEETGGLLAAVMWIGFGALALGPVLPHVTWNIVLYAVLSLTVVRMVPVAIAMLGRGVRAPTVAFIGWFGPRGLASLVFGLLVIERGVPEQNTLLTTVAVTVALSVAAARPDVGAARRRGITAGTNGTSRPGPKLRKRRRPACRACAAN